jgi:hypothetical protein
MVVFKREPFRRLFFGLDLSANSRFRPKPVGEPGGAVFCLPATHQSAFVLLILVIVEFHRNDHLVRLGQVGLRVDVMLQQLAKLRREI